MPGILCEHCTGYCCRYIALPIDEPTDKSEFDDIRWYLLHEGVSVFVEDGEWFINMQTTCRHLQPDYRCGIYETRPKICRDYSTDNCDYHSGSYGWEHHFTCPEHLDEYARQYLATQRDKSRKRKAGKKCGKLKARPGRRRKSLATDYAAARSDIRGVPLPLLDYH